MIDADRTGSGPYDITFANVDDRLTLLDQRPSDLRRWPHLRRRLRMRHIRVPTQADLEPAGITAAGASVAVSDLVLKRDIYYTLTPGPSDYTNLWDDRSPRPRSEVELFDALADPSQFAFLANLQPKDYPIGRDRFMMLGDNSPMSKDSRGWDTQDRRIPSIPIEEANSGWDTSNREAGKCPAGPVDRKGVFRLLATRQAHLARHRGQSQYPRARSIPYFARMRWIR